MSRSETDAAVELIRQVTEGKTLVMVEHDMGVVFGLADRISVLVYGEVIATGTPAEIRANAAVQEAYSGRDAMEAHMLEVRGPARVLRQEPHPARREPRRARGRDRQPARAQRRRPLDHDQGDHGPGPGAARCGSSGEELAG